MRTKQKGDKLVKSLLKFKDIEFLLKRQVPDVKFIKWTNQGAMLNVPINKLNPKKDKWGEIVLYTFENMKKARIVDFALTKQNVDDYQEFQMIIKKLIK